MAKKKVGTAGRFGARYGKKLRHAISEVEKKVKSKRKCPSCSKFKLRRVSSGIWQCANCRIKFAGKAYEV